MKKVLSVPEISCDHCERTIIGALQPLEGIHSVHVDVPAQHVSVEYDETRIGLERIKEVLLEEEYPVAVVSEQGR